MLSYFKPRSAIQLFIGRLSLSYFHFILVAILSLFYLLQGGIFISSVESLPPFPTSGWKRVESLFWLYALIFALAYSLLQFITLLVWKIAQFFGGTGTLKETRLALTWSIFCTAPLGFFLLLFQLTFNHPAIKYHYFTDTLAFAGALFFPIYGFIVCLKALSEVHHFSIGKALGVYTLAFFFLAVIVYFGFSFF